MGYLSTFRSEVHIEPPLTAAELCTLEFADDITPVVAVEDRDTDEGTLRVTRGVALSPTYEENKGYDFEANLRAAVAAAARSGSGHVLNGQIRVEGEEQGDVWRLVVKDNTVTVERARLVWPDGTAEESSRG